MSSQENSIPSPEAPASLNPEVCVFRHVALIQVPMPWRLALLHFGIALFDWSLEAFGIAIEEPDSLTVTARRVEAIADDLRTAGNQLAALGLEPEGSQVGRAELKLCDAAGLVATSVLEIASKLRKAAAEARQ